MNPLQLAPPSLGLAAGRSQERLNEVAERFQPGGGANITATHVVVFVILALVVAIVLWRVSRLVAMRDGRSYFNARRLFLDLCRLHELDLSSRRLLERLAHAHELQHASRLFLEPRWFEPAEIPAPLRPYRERVAELREQLFFKRQT